MADWLAEGNQLLDPLDLFGGQAARQASDIQLQLGDLGLQLQREFFNVLQADQAPVLATRDAAIGQIQGLRQGGEIPLDPSLQYQIGEQQRQLGTNLAARGKFNSGQRYVGEQDIAAGLTSQNVNQGVNRLLNLAGFQTSDLLNSNALLGQNVNAQAGQMQNQGAIQAAGRIGQLNAFNNLLGNAAGFAGQYGGNLFNQSFPSTDFGAPAYGNQYAGYA